MSLFTKCCNYECEEVLDANDIKRNAELERPEGGYVCATCEVVPCDRCTGFIPYFQRNAREKSTGVPIESFGENPDGTIYICANCQEQEGEDIISSTMTL